MNTVDWKKGGQIIISLRSNEQSGPWHESDGNPDPTTPKFEAPLEQLDLNAIEAQWVSEGKILIMVRNDHQFGGVDTRPTIIEVVAVP